MIDSPAQHVEDIRYLVKKTVISPKRIQPQTSEEVTRQIQDLIRGNAVITFYNRISWANKLKFLTCLLKKVRSLGTITLLLNTLHSVGGKVAAYCKSSKVTPIDFDREIYDHNRMFEPVTINKIIKAELKWFETLGDKEQVAFYITFLRFSGGALISELFQRIQVIYAQRLHKLSTVVVDQTQEKREEEKEKDEENISTEQRQELLQMLDERHDPEDPKHQNVLKLTKAFDDTINKFRKNVEKKMPKVKKEKPRQKGKKKEKKMKKKKIKKNKEELDWIQLMPIYIVKQIFTHLDKKSLNRAKKVNAYWKWAISELLKDKKERKRLNKMNTKLRRDAGHDCTLPDDISPQKQKPRVSHTEKRLQKLKQRGAILEELRLRHLAVDYDSSIITEALNCISDFAPYIENITVHGRVKRTKSPLYKKPQYIVKDYKVICLEDATTSDSEDDVVSPPYMSQSIVSASSDD